MSDMSKDEWDRAVAAIAAASDDEYEDDELENRTVEPSSAARVPAVQADPDDPDEPPRSSGPGRPCRKPGCTNLIPPGSHGARRYCDEHQPTPKRAKSALGDAAAERGAQAAKAALRPAPSSEEMDRLEANAKFLVEMGAAVLLMFGGQSPTLQADALDITKASPDLAKAIRNVAQHEEWLRRVLSVGPGSERAMAWVGLVLTAAPLTVSILVRHKVLPDEMTALASAVAGASAAAA